MSRASGSRWDPPSDSPSGWGSVPAQYERLSQKLEDPNPGRFGDAVRHSYAWLFRYALMFNLIWLAGQDLGEGGPRYLCIAFGIEATTWVWLLLIGSLLVVSTRPVGTAAALYYDFTGRTYVHDRIGFAKSGGQDIGEGLGLLAVVAAVSVFAFVIPPGPAGWLGASRTVAILILSAILGSRSTAWCVEKLYRRLYGPQFGPPPYRARRLRAGANP